MERVAERSKIPLNGLIVTFVDEVFLWRFPIAVLTDQVFLFQSGCLQADASIIDLVVAEIKFPIDFAQLFDNRPVGGVAVIVLDDDIEPDVTFEKPLPSVAQLHDTQCALIPGRTGLVGIAAADIIAVQWEAP